MTFFHFGNCVALAYGPYFVTYKYSSLLTQVFWHWIEVRGSALLEVVYMAKEKLAEPEYGAFWKCAQVGGIYIITQLCKMLILATFFPTTEGLSGTSNIISEIIKTTIDFGDLVGLGFVMSKTIGGGHSVGSGHIKILIAGLGWAVADLILTKALALWVGARGLQFDWKYILMSLDANVSLIHYLSMATLVWLWWRNDLTVALRPLVGTLLIFSVYLPILPNLLTFIFNSKPVGFTLLALSAIPTLCLAFIALHLFILHCSQVQSKKAY